MKESAFIDQNKEKWHKFDQINQQEVQDPDKVSDLFVDITVDLSYAQTFYPKRSVRVYLNSLAQRAFKNLDVGVGTGKSEERFWAKFIHFWKIGLPITMFQERKNLLLCFSIFLVSVLVGVLSTHFDFDFTRIILGDQYVDMTLDNIAKGTPMDIYSSGSKFDSFYSIALNNLNVSFLCFATGLLVSIGTIFIISSNGIMVGAFQYLFVVKGVFLTSFLTIWLHGTIEILSIVISGTAGIILGKGILYPGTYTRIESLQIAARRGIKIMVGMSVTIIIAAFIEGYITRLDMSNSIKWFIILASTFFMIGYFVWLPLRVGKRHPHLAKKQETPNFLPNKKIQTFKIRSFSDCFADGINLLGKTGKDWFKIAKYLILPINLLLFILLYKVNRDGGNFSIYQSEAAISINNYLIGDWWVMIAQSILLGLNASASYFYFLRITKPSFTQKIGLFFLKKGFVFTISFFLIMLIYQEVPFILFLLTSLLIPFLLNFLSGVLLFDKEEKKKWKIKTISTKDWGNSFLLFICSFGISVGLILLFSVTAVKSLFIDGIIQANFAPLVDNYYLFSELAIGFVAICMLHFSTPLLINAFIFLFYSNSEGLYAVELKESLNKFGNHRKTFEKADEGDY